MRLPASSSCGTRISRACPISSPAASAACYLEDGEHLREYVEAATAAIDGRAVDALARYHFWCALKEQEVEVEFETRSFLGLPRAVGVRRCTAFDRPQDVACGRRCVDSRFRGQWPSALPVMDRRRALGA